MSRGRTKRDKMYSRRKQQQSKTKRTDRQEKGKVTGRECWDVVSIHTYTHAAETKG